MRRIFTLWILTLFVLCTKSFGQNCQPTQPSNASCSEIVEDFNLSNGGFQSSTLVYQNQRFERLAPANTGSSSSITSRAFIKTGQLNVVQAGFDVSTGQNTTISSVTLEILDASNSDAVLATCLKTVSITQNTINSTLCFGITSTNIIDGASIKLRFTITSANSNNTQTRLIAFDNFRQAGANATLPVKFVSLSAKQSSSGTLLTWKVAEEEGVKSYEVEKGTNGKNFSLIGSVPASGNSSYTFNDASSAPVSFYRIKSVDIDGKFGYSSIISLKNGKEVVSMRVYPMPAQRQITVQHAMTTNNAKLLISTGDGRLVKSVIPAVGSMQTEVDLSNFKAGLYILSFEDGNGTKETMKFIKQ